MPNSDKGLCFVILSGGRRLREASLVWNAKEGAELRLSMTRRFLKVISQIWYKFGLKVGKKDSVTDRA